MSTQCRASFEKGINKTLDNLRQKETEPEAEASKADFKSETQQPKQIVNSNKTLEALGFKHSLKYGPRSNLRKACSYLLSVKETIRKRQTLSDIPIQNAFRSQKALYEEPEPKTTAEKLARS